MHSWRYRISFDPPRAEMASLYTDFPYSLSSFSIGQHCLAPMFCMDCIACLYLHCLILLDHHSLWSEDPRALSARYSPEVLYSHGLRLLPALFDQAVSKVRAKWFVLVFRCPKMSHTNSATREAGRTTQSDWSMTRYAKTSITCVSRLLISLKQPTLQLEPVIVLMMQSFSIFRLLTPELHGQLIIPIIRGQLCDIVHICLERFSENISRSRGFKMTIES